MFITRFNDLLVHKLTLYAHDYLAAQTSMTEFRQQILAMTNRNECHLINALQSFYRRHNLVCLALVLDGTKQPTNQIVSVPVDGVSV